MMTREDHLSLTSEIDAVKRLLSAVPSDRILEKRSLERRLNHLTREADSVSLCSIPRRLKVIFRGKPVVGSAGFFADFASDATGRFGEAVKAVVAGIKGGLKYMGPIPGADDSCLMITGVAKGSFGFEFEVPRSTIDLPGTLFDGLNETEVAIEKVRLLLEVAASENNDEDLAEIVAEIHPRAVKKVKEFLDVLGERDALCALDFNGRSFRFEDRSQLDLGRRRLDDANIHEDEQQFAGEIQGVLPKRRTFEFKVTGGDQVLTAKIGLEIEDPDLLNREYLHKPAVVDLHVTQVGQGRPRYVLHSLPRL